MSVLPHRGFICDASYLAARAKLGTSKVARAKLGTSGNVASTFSVLVASRDTNGAAHFDYYAFRLWGR